MFPVPTPTGKQLPRRVDSLKVPKTTLFTDIDEELRDVRRVHSQGQEEDLRMALSRTIGRVEELVRHSSSILSHLTMTDRFTQF